MPAHSEEVKLTEADKAKIEAERIQRLPYYKTAEEKNFKKLDELQAFLKTQDRKSSMVDGLTKLKFSQDGLGKLQLDYGQGPQVFTERGFNIFCKSFKMPPKYLEVLPYENMVKDIFASIAKSPKEKINFISKNNRLIGCSTKEEITSTEEVVNKLFETNHKDVKEMAYRDDRLYLSFTRDTVIPIPGDNLETGLSVHHDDGMGSFPTLSHYVWRLVCTNGMKTREIENLASFSNRMQKSKMFEVFNKRIEDSFGKINNPLVECITRMSKTKIINDDKKYYRSYLKGKMYFADHPEFESGFTSLIETNTESTFYDLMNFITNSALNLAVDEKDQLERLGGDMLAHFKAYKPSLDIFNGFTEFKRKKIHKEKNASTNNRLALTATPSVAISATN